jgi:hypothetical protein
MYLCRAALVLLATVTLAAGCGGSSDSTESPTAPSTLTVSTSSPPPSGVPAIAGTWSGTSDFESNNNVHLITTLSITVTQNSRNVAGTVQFNGSGWTRWRGSFTGTLSDTLDNAFIGSVSLQAEPSTGTGICTGQMRMSGVTSAKSMRWEAVSLTMAPSTPSQSPACLGTVRNIAWIFNR